VENGPYLDVVLCLVCEMIKCVKKLCLNGHELHFNIQFDIVIEEIINSNNNFNGFDVTLDSLELEKGDKKLGL
jgi:hypothetical protein